MNGKPDMKICVIGLGSMGLGIATSLLRNGFFVVGHDVQTEAQDHFAAAGGKVAPSIPAAAGGADIIICVVVNASQTEAVLFGQEGAAAVMNNGGTILSCATMSPDAARDFAQRAKASGVGYLDTPISGGAVRAAAGELTIMASGAPKVFAQVNDVLACISTKLYRLGDEPGIGAAFKTVNQLLAGVHIAAACEAMTFAKAMNLDLAKVYEVITGSAGNSWMFENRVPHILDGDYAPRSAIDIFTKDLGIVSDIGRDLKFPTPIASAALQMFVMTAAAGMGADDDVSIARVIARLAKLDLPGVAE